MNMLQHALQYHAEGLCVIPVKSRDKAPALFEWEEYQTRASTEAEIKSWWSDNPAYNIGLVHGVSGYATLDIDHDSGMLDHLRRKAPPLFRGRLEQSGSGEGYHIPLLLGAMPDLGYDNAKERPKGNKTWKTPLGNVNIRARWCQTVAPPSIHPSGKPYTFLADGPITRVNTLEGLIDHLNTLDKTAAVKAQKIERKPVERTDEGLDRLKGYFPILRAVSLAGVQGEKQKERNGEIRILGNGGLVIDEQSGTWYNFSDEMGGDCIDLFGWRLFGQGWNRYDKEQFKKVLMAMREIAGLGQERPERITQRYRPNAPAFKPSPYWR